MLSTSLSLFPFCNYTIPHHALRVKSFRDRILHNIAQRFGKKFVQYYSLTRIAARHDRARACERIDANNHHHKINHLLLNALMYLSLSECVSTEQLNFAPGERLPAFFILSGVYAKFVVKEVAENPTYLEL